ncbi:hypothetical protein RM550_09475 [Streptomyces sp. DSM 41527]|uniref:Uncharacterized protein n=1 Tax=Streptomyces mooreae TaxID=3075523 RepID=A0ABU2T408_9ACTN|nr:hypothetical protein [Streptomyces sp. DSM 41527]MDT0455968.1 hypothetical protein [Streptomyces sp. DSM 41527]
MAAERARRADVIDGLLEADDDGEGAVTMRSAAPRLAVVRGLDPEQRYRRPAGWPDADTGQVGSRR